MTRENLCAIVRGIARTYGYNRKAGLFWKLGAELVTLVHIQYSKWDNGVYINIGIAPLAIIEQPVPPRPGFGGLWARGESMDLPVRGTFEKMVTALDEVAPADCEAAFRWLFGWVEDNLTNEETIRNAVLRQDVLSGVARLGPLPTTWVMADWAHRTLRDRAYYFPRADR
jgi:hypothetical protein